MKIMTSYFYQIRFFKPYMIPLSTAKWDPKWFHRNQGQNYQFKDKNGEWLFSGLIHRTVMSPDFEQRFDSKEFRVGDEFRAYVCNFVDSDKGVRVVLTDSLGMIPKDSSTDSQVDSSTDE